MLDQPHLLVQLPALSELNPAFLNLQPPKNPKSNGLTKRQHPESYTELAAVQEAAPPPQKRQKATKKPQRTDENSLSAAAIVAPILVSTDPNGTSIDLKPSTKLSCSCTATFYEKYNLNKHQRKCQVHKLHADLSDLANQWLQTPNLTSGQAAHQLAAHLNQHINTFQTPSSNSQRSPALYDETSDVPITNLTTWAGSVPVDLSIRQPLVTYSFNDSFGGSLITEQNLIETSIKNDLQQLLEPIKIQIQEQEESLLMLMPNEFQPVAAPPTQPPAHPHRVVRDLSLPNLQLQLHNNDGLYMEAEDLPGTKAANRIERPSTLRHSWYKAVAHHFVDANEVHVKLHEVRITELKLRLEQRVDHYLLLQQYLIPLQALLDTVLDDESNFVGNLTNARHHLCEGKVQKPTRQWGTLINRPCNKLCYLTDQARKQLLSIEGQISSVIALQAQLYKEITTLERAGEAAMATGSLLDSCFYPKSKIAELDRKLASEVLASRVSTSQSASSNSSSKSKIQQTQEELKAKEQDLLTYKHLVANKYSDNKRTRKAQTKPARRLEYLAQPTSKRRVQPEHLDRSDWVPDFTDPDTEQPTAEQLKKLSKTQRDAFIQLRRIQFRRSLGDVQPIGGYFSKYLHDVKLDQLIVREAQIVLENEHEEENLKALMTKTIKDVVELKAEESSLSTIDFLFEVKQTRTRYKQVKQMFVDLDHADLMTDKFKFGALKVLNDWNELVKFHRKRTLPIMVHHDLLTCSKVQQGSRQYRISNVEPQSEQRQADCIWDKDQQLTEKDRLVTVTSDENSKRCIQTLFHRYFKDSVATLVLVKDGLTKMFFLLRHVYLILQDMKFRNDKKPPYVATLDRFLTVLRNGMPLADLRCRRTQSQPRWQKVLKSNITDSGRMQQLKHQVATAGATLKEIIALAKASNIRVVSMRDLAELPCMERVKKLVKTERWMRRFRRHYPKMTEMLGEQHLKYPELNRKVFMYYDEDGNYQHYIEGQSDYSSPPLSPTSSAKPSAAKLPRSMSMCGHGKKSCKVPTLDKMIHNQLGEVMKPPSAPKMSHTLPLIPTSGSCKHIDVIDRAAREQLERTIKVYGSVEAKEKALQLRRERKQKLRQQQVPLEETKVMVEEIKEQVIYPPPNKEGAKNVIWDSILRAKAEHRLLPSDRHVNEQASIMIQKVPTEAVGVKPLSKGRQGLKNLAEQREKEWQDQRQKSQMRTEDELESDDGEESC